MLNSKSLEHVDFSKLIFITTIRSQTFRRIFSHYDVVNCLFYEVRSLGNLDAKQLRNREKLLLFVCRMFVSNAV